MSKLECSKFPSKIAKNKLNIIKLPTSTNIMKYLTELPPDEMIAIYMTSFHLSPIKT